MEPNRRPRIVALTTSRADGRSSAAVCDAVSLALGRGVNVELLDLREVPLVFPEQDATGYPSAVTDVLMAVAGADVLIVGAAIIRSSVAGLARHWMEVLRTPLEGRPVVPVLAAGSQRSHLAADAFRGDLLLHFSAKPVVPVVVTPDLPEDELLARLDGALDAALALVPARVAS